MSLRKSLLLALLASRLAAAPALPPGIPVADLFRLPAIRLRRFSPDGRYLAALQSWNQGRNVIVVDLQATKKMQITSMMDHDVADVFLGGPERAKPPSANDYSSRIGRTRTRWVTPSTSSQKVPNAAGKIFTFGDLRAGTHT